jgi:putative hydrolase of the HAD superfamily
MEASVSGTPTDWPAPRGLLLDAMGTLINLRESVGQGYAAVAAEHGITLDAATIDGVFPDIYRQAPPLAFGALPDSDLGAAELNWWGDRIRATLAAVEAPEPDQDLVQALFDHFAAPERWRPYPEVLKQLERWRQKGLKLAVVSNFDRRLHGVLAGLGLSHLFETVVVSSEAGAAKPDPRPFALALEALGLSAEAAWHVGDSPEDLAGARAAGLRCVLIERGAGARADTAGETGPEAGT